MRIAKITLIVLSAALLAVGVSTTSYSFHSGGVAECGGCHSMHSPAAGGSFFLVGTDQSSTCLTCHEHAGDTGPSSYHVSTAPADMPAGNAPKQRGPGGDFGWLKKDYTYVSHGETTKDFNNHGHNIIAVDKGYTIDPDNASAPGSGGSFLSSNLGCQSCHDPHSSIRRDASGNYVKPALGTKVGSISGQGSSGNVPVGADNTVGVYRLLRGLSDASQGVTFPAGVAIAVAPSSYNATEATTQVRVAYGSVGADSTWGKWCATCHAGMHSSGNTVHPIDTGIGVDYAANYNAYVKSGDLTGTSATAYSSLVPYAENTGDIATLKSHVTLLTGPSSSDKVMCLSCHRAHASGWPEMLRWNMESEFITKAGVYNVTGSRTQGEAQAAYYDRAPSKFASDQRVLCNKCHAKD